MADLKVTTDKWPLQFTVITDRDVSNRLAFAGKDLVGIRQQRTAVKAEVHVSPVSYDVAKAVLQRFAGERITDSQQWLGVPLPRLHGALPRLDSRRGDRTGRGSLAVGEPGASSLPENLQLIFYSRIRVLQVSTWPEGIIEVHKAI